MSFYKYSKSRLKMESVVSEEFQALVDICTRVMSCCHFLPALRPLMLLQR